MIKVLIWNEFAHEKTDDKVKVIYPDGIHKAIADFLGCDDISVKTATLDDENCGITKEILDDTDVLLWWGHMRHRDVPDEIAMMVRDAVLEGMGMIFLHSAHHSKPFKFLMGTSCNLSWREDGDMERVWVTKPSHPIVQGIGRYFELEHEETYAEPFDIPEPDQTILMGWYEGGEVFRSGCVYIRGNGKIFYFQPGHESFPTYYNKDVQTVIKNAVYWAKPNYRAPLECPNIKKIGTE
ncbi:MAG: ThuA domain-containing protein [Clostridia bacterium]|nr:ThuA domain-containing protein [Clostridia bacterium]